MERSESLNDVASLLEALLDAQRTQHQELMWKLDEISRDLQFKLDEVKNYFDMFGVKADPGPILGFTLDGIASTLTQISLSRM